MGETQIGTPPPRFFLVCVFGSGDFAFLGAGSLRGFASKGPRCFSLFLAFGCICYWLTPSIYSEMVQNGFVKDTDCQRDPRIATEAGTLSRYFEPFFWLSPLEHRQRKLHVSNPTCYAVVGLNDTCFLVQSLPLISLCSFP